MRSVLETFTRAAVSEVEQAWKECSSKEQYNLQQEEMKEHYNLQQDEEEMKERYNWSHEERCRRRCWISSQQFWKSDKTDKYRF